MKRLFLLTNTLFVLFALAACGNLPSPAANPPAAESTLPVILLDTPAAVSTLPAGGAPTAEPADGSQGGLTDLNAFSQSLATALEGRDYAALRGLMGERFSIATWNTTLTEVTADEAMNQLRAGPLADGAQPAVRFGSDVPALLSGSDPLSLWGPVANPVQALHVMGLGALGNDEAVFVIGRNEAQGRYTLHGILLPPGGYFRVVSGPFEVKPAEVQNVRALEALNLRAGPGTQYDILGQVAAGEQLPVTAVSLDDGWWRVPCSLDSSGFCWLSSDPKLTQPVN